MQGLIGGIKKETLGIDTKTKRKFYGRHKIKTGNYRPGKVKKWG